MDKLSGMTPNSTHTLTISNERSKTPGIRVAERGAPKDINLTYLSDIITSTDENLALTDKALSSDDLRELAQATRAALLGLQNIAFHLAELHTGLSRGAINYDAEPHSSYGD